MATTIKDFYIIQHSHMDIGYTDLQEKVIYNQLHYIKKAIEIIKKGYAEDTVDKNFKWNCESYYCVELFLADSTEEEKKDFFDLVKKGNIGLSAMYLNFNDLVDSEVLDKRTAELKKYVADNGYNLRVAMNADVNGITMGYRDVFIKYGIEFFLSNIHTHHGMYPLNANMNAYYWENEEGKKLLVYNAEKYLLGNELGLVYNKNVDRIDYPDIKDEDRQQAHLERLRANIDRQFEIYDSIGYKEDFTVATISGKYSDNAPAYADVASKIDAFNKAYDDIKLHLVTIDEFYEVVKTRLKDIPTYKGDLNDWWAHGINSTPYPVKHYKEAVRMYHLCNRLNPNNEVVDVANYMRIAEDNILLYAEHTWGHSSTITNPYDTMVINLDLRNNSYASKAHEASAMALNRIQHALGDRLEYYDLDGKLKVVNPSNTKGKKTVEYYIEFYVPSTSQYSVAVVEDSTGKEMEIQISGHPRGMLITFVDDFKANETKVYTFKQITKKVKPDNSNQAYIGAERVADVITPYSDTYDLQHKIENDYFTIAYDVENGVTSFYNKVDKIEMLKDGKCKFFTPIYEVTDIRTNTYEERRLVGRNIRGVHAKHDYAKLDDIKVLDHGKIFTTVELVYLLQGTTYCSAIIKVYHQLAKIDFKYKFAKTIESAIESLYVPISLNIDKEVSFNKGGVKMRPGIDQLPGTNNEYYAMDCGLLYGDNLLIRSYDVPLLYAGELKHHAIKLCDNNPEDNKRDMYSWIMNNIWETNFKMDLSGFCEFCYSIEITNEKITNADMLNENCMNTIAFIIEEDK